MRDPPGCSEAEAQGAFLEAPLRDGVLFCILSPCSATCVVVSQGAAHLFEAQVGEPCCPGDSHLALPLWLAV
jgi:hypothetical protein